MLISCFRSKFHHPSIDLPFRFNVIYCSALPALPVVSRYRTVHSRGNIDVPNTIQTPGRVSSGYRGIFHGTYDPAGYHFGTTVAQQEDGQHAD